MQAPVSLELGGERAPTGRPTIAEFLAQIFTNAVYRAPFTELSFLVIPPEVRAIPERGLCKCSRIEHVQFFAQSDADFEPREGTVYVPESVERIGTLRLSGWVGERSELEKLAQCVLVRVPAASESAEKVSESPSAGSGLRVACE